MRRVIFFSEHVYQSRRRAGFHWLADAYVKAGWDTIFVTVGLSPLSRLKRDYRLDLVSPPMRNRFVVVRPGLRAFAWYPLFHPMNLRNGLANRVSQGLFQHYGALGLGDLSNEVPSAATIVVESASGLALVPRLRALAPGARLVYRVSDDIEVVGGHPVLCVFEKRAVEHFDLISLPSDLLASRFPFGAPVAVQYHGIEKGIMDAPRSSPYASPERKNVVAIGGTLFDEKAVIGFARSAPDVDFHLFGNLPDMPKLANLRIYGERPFRDLIPYLQNADAGLAPYLWRAGCEYLAHTSNKIMQYTYCRLPVLLPHYIPNKAPNVVSYKTAGDVGYREALEIAFSISRNSIDRSSIASWDQVRDAIEAFSPSQ